jgi:hypothetical protein
MMGDEAYDQVYGCWDSCNRCADRCCNKCGDRHMERDYTEGDWDHGYMKGGDRDGGCGCNRCHKSSRCGCEREYSCGMGYEDEDWNWMTGWDDNY